MPLYDGPVVDSHHHLFWDLDNYPWMHRPMRPMIFGDDWSALKREYRIEDLKADFATHNVVKSVHVQANFDISRPVDETAGLQAIADEHGFPQGIVGHGDLTDPNFERVLDDHLEYANLKGIRQQVYWHPTNELLAVRRPSGFLSFHQFPARPLDPLGPGPHLRFPGLCLAVRRPGDACEGTPRTCVSALYTPAC